MNHSCIKTKEKKGKYVCVNVHWKQENRWLCHLSRWWWSVQEARYNVIYMNHDFIGTKSFQREVSVRVDVHSTKRWLSHWSRWWWKFEMSLWRTASGKERSKVRYALCSQANTFQSMEAQYNVINMNHDFIRTNVFQMNIRVRVDGNWKTEDRWFFHLSRWWWFSLLAQSKWCKDWIRRAVEWLKWTSLRWAFPERPPVTYAVRSGTLRAVKRTPFKVRAAQYNVIRVDVN